MLLSISLLLSWDPWTDYGDPSTSRIPFSRKPAGFDLLQGSLEPVRQSCTFLQIFILFGFTTQSLIHLGFVVAGSGRWSASRKPS